MVFLRDLCEQNGVVIYTGSLTDVFPFFISSFWLCMGWWWKSCQIHQKTSRQDHCRHPLPSSHTQSCRRIYGLMVQRGGGWREQGNQAHQHYWRALQKNIPAKLVFWTYQHDPLPPEVETTKIKQEIELIPIFLKVLTRPDQTKFVYAQPDDYSINEILSP